jgi:hypothetical protein
VTAVTKTSITGEEFAEAFLVLMNRLLVASAVSLRYNWTDMFGWVLTITLIVRNLKRFLHFARRDEAKVADAKIC